MTGTLASWTPPARSQESGQAPAPQPGLPRAPGWEASPREGREPALSRGRWRLCLRPARREGGDTHPPGSEKPRGPLLRFRAKTAPMRSATGGATGSRVPARLAGDAPRVPPARRVLWFASSCFRCSGRKFAEGKGTFLPCNPELLPSNFVRGSLGTCESREPLPAEATGAQRRRRPGRELAGLPWAWARPAWVPDVCGCASRCPGAGARSNTRDESRTRHVGTVRSASHPRGPRLFVFPASAERSFSTVRSVLRFPSGSWL